MTTKRLPRTAPEIMARAAELGHVMAVRRRGPWPNDPHQKIYVSCSCGYDARVRRSEAAAKQVVAWHLGKVIGEAVDQTNGQEAARPPVRATARREDVRPTPAGGVTA